MMEICCLMMDAQASVRWNVDSLALFLMDLISASPSAVMASEHELKNAMMRMQTAAMDAHKIAELRAASLASPSLASVLHA
jgi:hypothetical protein